MYHELQVVRTTGDHFDEGAHKGTRGTVLVVFNAGEAYLVEFSDGDGQTLAMLTLREADLEPDLQGPA